MPGSISTPGKPTGLSAHLDETGAIILQCDALALATRYRFRGFVVGIETEYRLVGSSTEPLASVTGPMPGQTMQFAVQGVNDTLQGVLSDPIQFTMPPVAKLPVVEATPEVEVREVVADALAPKSANGSGSAQRALARV